MTDFNKGPLSIQQATDIFVNKNTSYKSKQTSEGVMNFEQFLFEASGKVDEVKFSKHANQRLESRNISLSDEQMQRLNDGVNRARNKSINESLVMMDDLAFIVSVKNNTVVTALETDEDNSVFTNIDGAVIV